MHRLHRVHCVGLQVHAAFHNVTAMVGAGVLGLPNAMVSLYGLAIVHSKRSQKLCCNGAALSTF